MSWVNKFIEVSSGTRVEVTVKFASVVDLEKIIEMGFQEGFTMAHDNLDELLAAYIFLITSHTFSLPKETG